MDNISAVRYINKLGGTKSSVLAEIAKDFWHYCLTRQISFVAEYLPGQSNVIPDWNSRHLRDFSDWQLQPQIVEWLQQMWGSCDIDLFASRLNRQMTKFFSRRPDPLALVMDALSQDWSRNLKYAFPPFILIPRIFTQIMRQRVEVILVTPLWKSQPWFPILIEASCDLPIKIPWASTMLQGPHGETHSMVISGQLSLMAWRLSGNIGKCQSFQRKLQLSSVRLGPPPPRNNTFQPGNNGFVGALNSTWIPWGPVYPML